MQLSPRHTRSLLLAGAGVLAAIGCSCSSSDAPVTAGPDTSVTSTTAPALPTGSIKPADKNAKQCAALAAYLLAVFRADDALAKNATRDGLADELEKRGNLVVLEQGNAGSWVKAVSDDLKARLAVPPDAHAKGTQPKPTFPPDVEKARKELDLVRHTTCKTS